MVRSTIDYGIDLGTTNSSVAWMRERGPEVIKSGFNSDSTPSAIYVNADGQLIIGKNAYERGPRDEANYHAEFKLQMGTSVQMRFARSKRPWSAEELSAEVLKSLCADARRMSGEDLASAVITVPADFDLPACEATRKAAELAGLHACPLLQEPIAAALAYGSDSLDDRQFWLTYDLGGGTFDAAVMQMRDKQIRSVNHGGDKQLGGKIIDWVIVEQILIPAVQRRYSLTDFKRSNPAWAGAMAKLKQAAENAKISLSRDDTADIWVDNLSSDSKAGLEFEYKLTRAELMPLMDPIITRSVNICRQVLQEQRLTPRDISRILLVGGPTLSPYLRERLSDAESGLGIPLEFSIDPMTVVARGAAIYAGSQPLVSAQVFAPPAGAFAITFPNWRFSGSDEEVLTAGNVQSPNSASLAGYTVTVTNSASRPAWQSGRVPVADSGGFMLELFADKSTLNTYTVELSDNLGRRMQSATNPPVLTYRYQRNEIMAPPLTHTVGIELADGSMEILVRKGAPLPAHIRSKFRTIVDLLPDGDQPLKIPLREGGQPRADCNDPIGVLKIEPSQVHRAVPAGTELDITIDIDLSRLVTCKAYIALLDEEFTKVMDLSAIPLPSPAKMQQEFNAQRERLDTLREQAQETDDLRAKGILDQIEREKMLYEIETSLAASVNDPDAADKCEERIRDLKAALNAAEDSLRLPNAMSHADAVANLADQIINEFGDDADRKNVEQLKVQVQEAKRAHDVALLEQRNGELRDYCLRLLNKGGVLQILWFQQLKQERAKMSDQHQAEVYFAMGERALANKDVDGLKAVNRQLIDMLPDPPPPPDISTIMKA